MIVAPIFVFIYLCGLVLFVPFALGSLLVDVLLFLSQYLRRPPPWRAIARSAWNTEKEMRGNMVTYCVIGVLVVLLFLFLEGRRVVEEQNTLLSAFSLSVSLGVLYGIIRKVVAVLKCHVRLRVENVSLIGPEWVGYSFDWYNKTQNHTLKPSHIIGKSEFTHFIRSLYFTTEQDADRWIARLATKDTRLRPNYWINRWGGRYEIIMHAVEQEEDAARAKRNMFIRDVVSTTSEHLKGWHNSDSLGVLHVTLEVELQGPLSRFVEKFTPIALAAKRKSFIEKLKHECYTFDANVRNYNSESRRKQMSLEEQSKLLDQKLRAAHGDGPHDRLNEARGGVGAITLLKVNWYDILLGLLRPSSDDASPTSECDAAKNDEIPCYVVGTIIKKEEAFEDVSGCVAMIASPWGAWILKENEEPTELDSKP